MTAGNNLENFIFLFSTGPKLDKLSIKGSVKGEDDNKAKSEVLVVLYDNLSDTVLTTQKPVYLTRTDKEGNFSLENLRADTFQIFALKDDNVSYTYDSPTEQVAFLDSLLVLTEEKDSIVDIELLLFDEEDDPLFLESRESRKGLIKTVYLPLPRSADINLLDTSFNYFSETRKDTFYTWHQNTMADSLLISVAYDNQVDTNKVRLAKKSMADVNLVCETASIEISKGDSLFVEWNKPLDSISIDSVSQSIILSDTSQNIVIKEIGITERNLWLLSDSLVSGNSYTIKIDSAVIVDWYGVSNMDSVVVDVTTIDTENLGKIILTVEKSDSLAYVLTVKNNNDIIEKQTIISQEVITLSNLQSGKYQVEILQDINGDGMRTGSNLKAKRRAERKASVDLEQLKKGWELEATISITELFDATKSN